MMKTCSTILGIAVLFSASSALACPPPAFAESARLADESEDAYYDRLIAGSYPNSWVILGAPRPTRNTGETDQDFATRRGAWNEADAQASRRASDRANTRRLELRGAEESARWASPQIVLAESLGPRANARTVRYPLRIITHAAGRERHRTAALEFPFMQTDCDAGPPELPAGMRIVIFARPGPITNDSMIAFYDRETAQDIRTRALLEGRRQDAAAENRNR
jgi:hypothetical protein